MFCVVDKRCSNGTVKYGIVDTNDGVVEYYTINELVHLIQNYDIKIQGINSEYRFKFLESIDTDAQFLFKTFINHGITVSTVVMAKHSKWETRFFKSDYYGRSVDFYFFIDKVSDLEVKNLPICCKDVKNGYLVGFSSSDFDEKEGYFGVYKTVKDAKRAILIWSQSIGGNFQNLIKKPSIR